MFKNRFTTYPTPTETTWGIRYLLFELAFLPGLLSLALGLLNINVTPAEFNFCCFLVNFLAVLWIFRNFFRDSLKHTVKNAIPFGLAVMLGLAAYWSMNQVLSNLIYLTLPDFYNVNDAAISADVQSQFLLTVISTVLLVPKAEECLFRGLLFSLFRQRGRLAAYVVSTLLFCAIHISGYVGLYDWWVLGICFVQYIPAGVALAWAFEASGSIYAPIAIHIIVNLTAILSMR